MTIHQFNEKLQEEGAPTPLFEALQSLRALSLDELRNPETLSCDWGVWTDEGVAQTPKTYVRRPELLG